MYTYNGRKLRVKLLPGDFLRQLTSFLPACFLAKVVRSGHTNAPAKCLLSFALNSATARRNLATTSQNFATTTLLLATTNLLHL